MPELRSPHPDAASDAAPDVSPGTGTDSGRPRWWSPAMVGVGLAAGCGAILAIDPQDSGVPICWSQAFLDIDCPLCGGLRCTNALLRGDIAAALDHNVLAAVALPVIAVLWAVWLYRSIRGEEFRLPKPPVWVIGAATVAVVAFTVARNLDASGWIGWLGSTA